MASKIGNVTVTARTASVIRKMIAFQRDHKQLKLVGVEKVADVETCECCGHPRMTLVHHVQDVETGETFRIGIICKQAVLDMDLQEVIGHVA